RGNGSLSQSVPLRDSRSRAHGRVGASEEIPSDVSRAPPRPACPVAPNWLLSHRRAVSPRLLLSREDRVMLRSKYVRLFALYAVAALGAARPAHSGLVLNEVLYDPAGADEGQEFVELWNPDSTTASLDGVSIEAGDGARPDVWSVVWRAPPGIHVAPGGAFLVAGGALTGALQNGPDAVRLVRGTT